MKNVISIAVLTLALATCAYAQDSAGLRISNNALKGLFVSGSDPQNAEQHYKETAKTIQNNIAAAIKKTNDAKESFRANILKAKSNNGVYSFTNQLKDIQTYYYPKASLRYVKGEKILEAAANGNVSLFVKYAEDEKNNYTLDVFVEAYKIALNNKNFALTEQAYLKAINQVVREMGYATIRHAIIDGRGSLRYPPLSSTDKYAYFHQKDEVIKNDVDSKVEAAKQYVLDFFKQKGIDEIKRLQRTADTVFPVSIHWRR